MLGAGYRIMYILPNTRYLVRYKLDIEYLARYPAGQWISSTLSGRIPHNVFDIRPDTGFMPKYPADTGYLENYKAENRIMYLIFRHWISGNMKITIMSLRKPQKK